MHRLLFLVPIPALIACHPTQIAQSCPIPATAPASLLVSQVMFRRSPNGGPSIPDYTLSLTASGDALYVGSRTVPISGEYMGRLGPTGFQHMVSELVARGMQMDGEKKTIPDCTPQPLISISLQTADGRYSEVTFCGRSESESKLARPIYAAIEQIRWYPGARLLALGPS